LRSIPYFLFTNWALLGTLLRILAIAMGALGTYGTNLGFGAPLLKRGFILAVRARLARLARVFCQVWVGISLCVVLRLFCLGTWRVWWKAQLSLNYWTICSNWWQSSGWVRTKDLASILGEGLRRWYSRKFAPGQIFRCWFLVQIL
jgi:hypothetical protein